MVWGCHQEAASRRLGDAGSTLARYSGSRRARDAGSGWGMKAAADGHVTASELAAMTPEGGGIIIEDKLQRQSSWQRVVVWQHTVVQ